MYITTTVVTRKAGIYRSTGGRKPATGVRRPDTGGGPPDAGGKRPVTGGWQPDTGGRWPHTGGGPLDTSGGPPATSVFSLCMSRLSLSLYCRLQTWTVWTHHATLVSTSQAMAKS